MCPSAPVAEPDARSPASLEQLARLRPRLLAIASRITHDRSVAEDLVQLTMLRAIERLDTCDQATDWSSWTATVVRRLAIDHWRRLQRFPEIPHDDARGTDMSRAQSEPGDGPIGSATTSLLDLALQRAPAPARDICRLHYLHGLSYARIARLLGIPLRTVGTRLHRARQRVRKELLRLVQQRAAAPLSRTALLPPRIDGRQTGVTIRACE